MVAPVPGTARGVATFQGFGQGMVGIFPLRLGSRLRRAAASSPGLPCLAAATALWLAPVTAADAQVRGYFSSDPNVSVDLSVLGGPGAEPVPAAPLPGRRAPGVVAPDIVTPPSGLLFPPPAMPQSRLVGRYTAMTPPPPEAPAAEPRPTLTPPRSRLNVPPPQAAPQPAPQQPVARQPAPAPTGTPAARVAAAPPPQPTAEPAPAPAPAAPVEQTAAASAPVPPPPTMPKPAAAPAPAAPPPAATTQAPAPATPSVETAARAPDATADSGSTAPDGLVRVLFDGGSAKLPDTARGDLQALASQLDADADLRVQLEAYAEGSSDTASQARRLSLSRALAVRSFLIDQGVRSTRMDVRALGNKPSDPPGPADRVDARLIKR